MTSAMVAAGTAEYLLAGCFLSLRRSATIRKILADKKNETLALGQGFVCIKFRLLVQLKFEFFESLGRFEFVIEGFFVFDLVNQVLVDRFARYGNANESLIP